MTWTRTKQLGEATITATLQWSPGYPSTRDDPGEPAGWDENTGAEITCGPFVTYITFSDHELGGNPITEVDDWIVDTVETACRHHQEGGEQMLTLADTCERKRPGGYLRLSALPEVLEVVKDAHEDCMASERLSVLSESLYLLCDQREVIRYEASEAGRALTAEEDAKLAMLNVAVEDAQIELEHARRYAQERGVKT